MVRANSLCWLTLFSMSAPTCNECSTLKIIFSNVSVVYFSSVQFSEEQCSVAYIGKHKCNSTTIYLYFQVLPVLPGTTCTSR